jgi:hypothetical protein
MGKIKAPKEIKSVNRPGEDYPLFCFKHLSPASIRDCREHRFFYDFLMRLTKLSEIGWAEIRKSGRHHFGMESLPVNRIKKQLPAFVTPDVQKLHVLRANDDRRPFIGLQRDKVFHVLFIESKFGDIYDHD